MSNPGSGNRTALRWHLRPGDASSVAELSKETRPGNTLCFDVAAAVRTRLHFFVVIVTVGIVPLVVDAPALDNEAPADRASSLERAQRLFYNRCYEAAATTTAGTCASDADDLAACELHTSALLFQIKRALGASARKDEKDRKSVV